VSIAKSDDGFRKFIAEKKKNEQSPFGIYLPAEISSKEAALAKTPPIWSYTPGAPAQDFPESCALSLTGLKHRLRVQGLLDKTKLTVHEAFGLRLLVIHTPDESFLQSLIDTGVLNPRSEMEFDRILFNVTPIGVPKRAQSFPATLRRSLEDSTLHWESNSPELSLENHYRDFLGNLDASLRIFGIDKTTISIFEKPSGMTVPFRRSLTPYGFLVIEVKDLELIARVEWLAKGADKENIFERIFVIIKK
jgi:hypothetical protein